MSNKKMTFAEKLKMQDECGSPKVEQKVEEKVEERPKKERKPRKKVEKKIEVVEEAVEQPKKERKSRKKEVLEGGVVEPESKPVKKEKRPPSAYNLFVKDAYKSKDVQKLAPKERFAKVAEMWHKHKGKK
jgi:hypothetical protein